jgi:hypothetical protein
MGPSLNEINQVIINDDWDLRTSKFGEVFRIEGPIIKRGPQTFIIDGNIAYDITPIKIVVDDEYDRNHGATCCWTPVIIGGKCFYSAPDEGRSGILTYYEIWDSPRLIRCPYENFPPGQYKSLIWISYGWLNTRELEMSNSEIEDILVSEVLSGENVFTKKPAGWV